MDASQGWERKRVLITVKTYPTPSTKHQETVCTAGITSDGQWIRLYPVSFRYQPYDKWCKKYQWVDVRVRRKAGDPRPETYQPDCSTFELGEILEPGKDWAARRDVVLPTAVNSVHELQARGASLGVFKPAEVIDFTWEETDSEWSEAQAAILGQMSLFEAPGRVLEKMPWKFHYHYRCSDPACNGHRQQILDWELFQGYRSWVQRYGNVDVALAKLREKWLDQMWAPERDSYLFVGTHYLHQDSYMVLGVFWPPKTKAASR